MIKKWYKVSCDLCGNGLNHYAELKPTCTDLRRDGFKVKINNGKVFVFCKECYEKIKKETNYRRGNYAKTPYIQRVQYKGV